MEKTPRVAIVPSPGMGHLIPLVELAKRLVTQHGFSVTFILPTDEPLTNAQRAYLQSLPPESTSVLLLPVNLDDLGSETSHEARTHQTISLSLPSLRKTIGSLVQTTRLVSLVVDVFGTDAFDVAKEFNLSPCIFFTSTATVLSFIFYLPKLDEMVSEGEFRDMPDPIQIPGCVPIHGRDLLDPVQNRKSDAYKLVLYHAKRYVKAEVIMVNSLPELEAGPIKALKEQGMGYPPVYPIGPLIQTIDDRTTVDEQGSRCLKWLDSQPVGSVLFICFGSRGTLSHDQIIELALGLEMSEHRFLWAVRSPNDTAGGAGPEDDNFDFLPEGFVDRTKTRALVVPSWAPQALILSHGSTGGFVSHCGWNSALESVVNGVPMIAWPLYAEQKMNAIQLSEDIRIALKPKADTNGLIGRSEISRVIKSLMEGEDGKRIRIKTGHVKDAAFRAIGEGGSSANSLHDLASKWKDRILYN